MTEYEDHALAAIFPLMGDADLDALGADIEANGLRDAVWLYEGKILDGRNRYRACKARDVDPRFEAYKGKDALGFVISKNLHRRHMTESQRAMAAAEIAKWQRGDNQHTGGSANLRTLAQAADALDVSKRSAENAAAVQSKGVPELVEAVKSGEVSVSAAAEVAKLPKAKQKKAVADGTVKETAAKQRKAKKAEATPAEPKPAPAKIVPPPAVDSWGIPVQPHAAEAFAGAGQFDAVVAKIRDCMKDVSALVDTPAGKHLLKHVQWVRSDNKAGGRWVLAHLDNALTTVANAKPAVTDCPYAFNPDLPHPDNCRVCHNLRWSGTLKNHQIPPVMTAAMKEHYGVKEVA